MLVAERDDFNRNRKTRSEPVTDLGFVNYTQPKDRLRTLCMSSSGITPYILKTLTDHNKLVSAYFDNFFPEKSSSSPLGKAEFGINSIGTIDSNINL